MAKIPGVNHLDAVRAFEKAGFAVVRQGKHIIMSDGRRILTIPRHDPINAFTLGGIVRDAGLTVDQFNARKSEPWMGSDTWRLVGIIWSDTFSLPTHMATL